MQEPNPKAAPFSPEEESPTGRDAIDAAEGVDELDELEDEFDDDGFLEEYRQRRMKELSEDVEKKSNFGSFEIIRGKDFVKEVTEASERNWVVCHLYKDSVSDCAILNACLVELAERYPETKFVKILSTDCIPGFPDENLPTLLLYHKKKCVHTIVGLAAMGGQSVSLDRIALVLNQYGSICGSDTETHLKGIVKDLIDKYKLNQDDDDDDDK